MIDPYIAFCMIMTVSGIQLDPINVVLDRHGKLVADFPGSMILAAGDSIDSIEFQIEGCPGQQQAEDEAKSVQEGIKRYEDVPPFPNEKTEWSEPGSCGSVLKCKGKKGIGYVCDSNQFSLKDCHSYGQNEDTPINLGDPIFPVSETQPKS